MSDFDDRKTGVNSPHDRAQRLLEIAHEFIDGCERSPDDLFQRRSTVAFLGELTRRYVDQNNFPKEGVACFWRFLEAVPAYDGQADALGALDHGPRGAVVEAMQEAAAGIRDRARRWAEGVARRRVNPRHLVLVTLPFSGVSAIAPILEEYLKPLGFTVVNDVHAFPGALAEAEAKGTRVFAWFHRPHEAVESYLQRQDIALAYLHRDPRDVMVSSMCIDEPDPATLFAYILGCRLDELCPDSAPYFMALAEADPGAWATTFPAMKADVPGCVLRMLRLLDLPVDEMRVRQLADAYSFKALAGHREGEGATFRRLGPYVVRKGTSGQWRERFDRSCALFFAAKYGHLLLASGWAADMDWIDEVQG